MFWQETQKTNIFKSHIIYNEWLFTAFIIWGKNSGPEDFELKYF